MILTHSLAGNYVNFGVFDLYGDRALSDALDVALKMALSIPMPDIMAYRKVRVLVIGGEGGGLLAG
jgi:exportin-7